MPLAGEAKEIGVTSTSHLTADLEPRLSSVSTISFIRCIYVNNLLECELSPVLNWIFHLLDPVEVYFVGEKGVFCVGQSTEHYDANGSIYV